MLKKIIKFVVRECQTYISFNVMYHDGIIIKKWKIFRNGSGIACFINISHYSYGQKPAGSM